MNTSQVAKFLLIILLTITLISFAAAEESIEYYAPKTSANLPIFCMNRATISAPRVNINVISFISRKKAGRCAINCPLLSFCRSNRASHPEFSDACTTHPEGQFVSRAYYQIGATYFLTDQFEQSARFLREALPHIIDTRQHAEAEQLIGLSYLMQKQWSEAGEVFKTLQGSNVASVSQKAIVYHNFAEAGADLPTRSPFLAGVLSTIVPGAGRLYTGRLGDALTSLFTVTLTGWQAYDGFRRMGFRR